MHTRMTFAITIATCICGAALVASAEPRRGPPAEAYAACSAKSQGDTCSVQLRDHDVSGVCAPDGEQKLFCRPDRPPEGRRTPPPQALAACSGKKDGETCAVTMPGGSMRSGVCIAGRGDETACMAEPPPPRN